MSEKTPAQTRLLIPHCAGRGPSQGSGLALRVSGIGTPRQFDKYPGREANP